MLCYFYFPLFARSPRADSEIHILSLDRISHRARGECRKQRAVLVSSLRARKRELEMNGRGIKRKTRHREQTQRHGQDEGAYRELPSHTHTLTFKQGKRLKIAFTLCGLHKTAAAADSASPSVFEPKSESQTNNYYRWIPGYDVKAGGRKA